ncbi:MAG: hypothetical protein ACP5M9_02410 [Candidatus Micrarchaeia archaeon]
MKLRKIVTENKIISVIKIEEAVNSKQFGMPRSEKWPSYSPIKRK